MEALQKGRKIHGLLDFLVDISVENRHIQPFDNAKVHLASLFDSIEVQRNNAVHPMEFTVSDQSVSEVIIFRRAVESRWPCIVESVPET